jgi:hypothetical protein
MDSPELRMIPSEDFQQVCSYDNMTGTVWFLLSFQSKDDKLQRLFQYFAGLSPPKLDAAYNLYID